MASHDAAALAQRALSLKLVTDAQIQEAYEELGEQSSDGALLLRSLERKGYLTPWQSQKLLKGDSDGFYLGGYRLLYKVASGSFGRVFRADDPQTGAVVAIKVLRRRWSEVQRNIELFEREGKVGMALRHPNIVPILAVSRDVPSNQYFIVMEFVEGGNLRDFLSIRKKLNAAEALRLMEDTVAGLVHAYARGVTHRDIKLTNILISTQGEARLVDFGLAGIYTTQGRREEEGLVDRTVDYAGLERATGVKPGDVRSDLYFLGCVLYEMLTGRSPLPHTKDKQARMRKERFLNLPAMKSEEVSAPPLVHQLVQTMMSLNPSQRYQTPSQLLEAIRRARAEVAKDNAGSDSEPKERSVFVVEKSARLRDVMREKLKELGYRVYMAGDPLSALTRFRQQPYDALVVDAGTAGEDGLLMFEKILSDAQKQNLACAGILILAQEQADWAKKVPEQPTIHVMVRPVTLKALHQKLGELVAQK